MKLYISGGMSGYPAMNFPAFNRASERLENAGYDVVNPATLGEHASWLWADYLKRDLVVLLECDGVALLPEWSKSRGARLEVTVAEELGMTCQAVDEWITATGRRP